MLSIVIPVFNEESCIGKLLADLRGSCMDIDYEIIVVDDSSDDSTRDIVSNGRIRDKRISLISRSDGKHGMGRSLKKGFGHAKGDIIVVVMGTCLIT